MPCYTEREKQGENRSENRYLRYAINANRPPLMKEKNKTWPLFFFLLILPLCFCKNSREPKSGQAPCADTYLCTPMEEFQLIFFLWPLQVTLEPSYPSAALAQPMVYDACLRLMTVVLSFVIIFKLFSIPWLPIPLSRKP